jgi:SP family general alpha glucoside:H+ symporter-like MFS transporter
MATDGQDAIGKETAASGGALHFPPKDDLAHTKSMNEVIHNARAATDKEHRMTLWQGIKLYPKAVGWSLLISTCIAMEGYDVCLLSNFCEYRDTRVRGGYEGKRKANER